MNFAFMKVKKYSRRFRFFFTWHLFTFLDKFSRTLDGNEKYLKFNIQQLVFWTFNIHIEVILTLEVDSSFCNTHEYK